MGKILGMLSFDDQKASFRVFLCVCVNMRRVFIGMLSCDVRERILYPREVILRQILYPGGGGGGGFIRIQ
jgi:hypothetical protein